MLPTILPLLDSPAGRAVACCAPLTREAPERGRGPRIGRGVLKALTDPARLRLLSMIAAHDDGEACVCELTEPLDLSQPTVSRHLKGAARRRAGHPQQAWRMGLLPLSPRGSHRPRRAA